MHGERHWTSIKIFPQTFEWSVSPHQNFALYSYSSKFKGDLMDADSLNIWWTKFQCLKIWKIFDVIKCVNGTHVLTFHGRWILHIGGRNRGAWPLLNLMPLHRNVIFAIENHFSLAKWPPLLLVASSASDTTFTRTYGRLAWMLWMAS